MPVLHHAQSERITKKRLKNVENNELPFIKLPQSCKHSDSPFNLSANFLAKDSDLSRKFMNKLKARKKSQKKESFVPLIGETVHNLTMKLSIEGKIKKKIKFKGRNDARKSNIFVQLPTLIR